MNVNIVRIITWAVSFLHEYRHEGGIKIENDDIIILGLVVQLSHGLFQQEVVEIHERVFGSIALSE
jgi:hypothetical protein